MWWSRLIANFPRRILLFVSDWIMYEQPFFCFEERRNEERHLRGVPAFRVVNKMASKLSGQWGGWWKSIDGFVAGGGKRNFIIAFVMRFLLYCLQAIVRLEVYREWSGQRVQCRRLFAMYTYTTPAESLIWCVKNTRSSRTGKRFFSFAAIKFSSNFLL